MKTRSEEVGQLNLYGLLISPEDHFQIFGAGGYMRITVKKAAGELVIMRMQSTGGEVLDQMVPFDHENLSAQERRDIVKKMIDAGWSYQDTAEFLCKSVSTITNDYRRVGDITAP